MCNISYFLIYLYTHAVLEFGSEEVKDKCKCKFVKGINKTKTTGSSVTSLKIPTIVWLLLRTVHRCCVHGSGQRKASHRLQILKKIFNSKPVVEKNSCQQLPTKTQNKRTAGSQFFMMGRVVSPFINTCRKRWIVINRASQVTRGQVRRCLTLNSKRNKRTWPGGGSGGGGGVRLHRGHGCRKGSAHALISQPQFLLMSNFAKYKLAAFWHLDVI